MTHPLKRIAAAVGVGHGLLGVPHRPGHLAQRQLQLAQVAGVDGGLFQFSCLMPISSPARIGSRASVSRPKARKVEGGFVQQPGLVGFRERGRDAAPRRLEEAGDGSQVGTERAEFLAL